MATERDTTIFDNLVNNKFIQDARDADGRTVSRKFELTVESASATDDTYNLTVVPANARVVHLECVTDGLGASAGAGVLFQIGDADDADRYMVATDFDAAEARGTLAFAGMNHTPTSDTTLVGKITTTAAVVGKKVSGRVEYVPGA